MKVEIGRDGHQDASDAADEVGETENFLRAVPSGENTAGQLGDPVEHEESAEHIVLSL